MKSNPKQTDYFLGAITFRCAMLAALKHYRSDKKFGIVYSFPHF